MSNRDIKKFLPPIFKTKEITNFLDSTTNKLFEEKQSERVNYYIGKKSGGVYEHLTDPYAEERTKLREDYQLEPSLTERDPQTGQVNSILYYEDLLNNLKSSGAFVTDQNRLFQQEVYSYAPPIDYDMFVNFRDYYWVPEGAPAIEIDALPEDIVGNINYGGKVKGVDEFLPFTTGNHVILNDGKEYVVDGVGDSIRLQEFDLSNDKPLRVTRTFFSDTLSVYEQFPKEYITMERGASDNNPWSRNNSWYHRDALYPNVSTRPDIRIERERRALRPIIQFIRDIELVDYHRGTMDTCDVYFDGVTLPADEIDSVPVTMGMTAIKKNSKKVYQYDGTDWNETSTPDGIVVVTNGRMNKSTELFWDTEWKVQQQKNANTQPILFQLYDSIDRDSAQPIDEGNTIFSYKEDDAGTFDEELQLTIEFRMSGDSSDYTFENSIRSKSVELSIPDLSYKIINTEIPIAQRLLEFTIGTDVDDNETILVNDNDLPTIIINSGISYEFDYSDSSTTANGWFGKYFPITIVDGDGNQLVRPTHGHSQNTRVTFEYDLGGLDEVELFYRLETDYSVTGSIIVLPDVEIPEFELHNEFRRKGTMYTTLRQKHEVIQDGDVHIELDYQPMSDDFTVMMNGEDVSDFEFIRRVVTLRDMKKGALVEVFYSTRNKITNTDNIIQEVYPALSNNGGNDDPLEFSFSEVFNHFGSIIRNQRFLDGTPLGTNNYRDTGKDISVGDDILKHTAPMIPLMFVNKNDNINLLEAIEHSSVFYTQYKNNVILKSEEYVRDFEVDVINVKDVFDTIISDLNAAKQSNESFSGSYMFASYRNYISIGLDENGVLLQPVDLVNPRNTMYVYTEVGGLQIVQEDYDVILDEATNTYTLVPFTFELSDIDIIRYYDDVQPTFCPATPAKFGIFKPIKPTFFIDDTYANDVLMIVGHDNSKTVAYTTLSDYASGIIDGRDMILFEFENRIYNGINREFKLEDQNVVDAVRYIPGKFRKIEYTREEYNALEYEKFFRWSTLNMTDYTTNISYVEGDAFTYNYSYNVDHDGEYLPGHWKGIYTYYYDTYIPHRSPWEMLGFDVKPSWFDDEYGTDYSSLNDKLWDDLEDGIIRQGIRSNVIGRAYLNDNPYRRVGLSNFIPVDTDGNLKTPVDIGICDAPTSQDAKKPWRYGDRGPVEHAWKTLSEYAYSRISVMYLLKPADIVVRIWDTEATVGNDNLQNIKVSDYKLHREHGSEAVFGLTQWIYDLVLGDNLKPNDELIEPFRNLQLNLAHKVGGFVNASELRLFSESYNPDSETLSTLVPNEDVNVITYQSKDIFTEAYSGVVIERVEASKAYFTYIDGYNYTLGDIVYTYEDDAYYRKLGTTMYDKWASGTTYHVGDEVEFNSTIYVCIDNHTGSNMIRPEDTDYWNLKPFIMSEWAIMINPPKNSQTEFRVYGYNIRSPFFPVSIPVTGSNRKRISVTTSNSKPIYANEWAPNTYYKRGHIVIRSDMYYEADVSHRSGSGFDSQLWVKWSTTPMMGNVDVTYPTESSGNVDMVEYGQRFRSTDDVVNFLANYGRQLENRGWQFKDYDNEIGVVKNWEFVIKEFVRWTVDHREVGSAITLSPFSTTANFKPKHGVVSLLNQFKRSAFNLMDYRSAIIPSETINVTRNNNVFKLESPEPIYFLRLGIREYEHSINVSNETIFADVNYDPIIGIRKDRLRVSGTKTTAWDGTLHAPGYIITDDDMIPNLTTVSQELLEINDMDTVATKDIINELKYHNLGYQKRSYLENLEMTDKSQINFYQGFIRQKGTSEAFQRLLRSNVIDANDTLDISEEWAFREGVFGSNYNRLQVEFFIAAESFNFNPQKLNLVYNNHAASEDVDVTNIDFDNPNEWIMKPERVRKNGGLWDEIKPKHAFKSSGYVQYQEHKLKSISMKELNANMLAMGLMPETNTTAWIAVNEMTHGSWDVLVLNGSTGFIGEIYNHGNDGENSAVVKAYNIDEDALYVVTHPDGYYNITFRYIKDGYYIMLSHDDSEYVTFNPNVEYMELSISEWKSTRIIDDHDNKVIPTVSEYLTENEITPFEGMFMYRDSTSYNDGEWTAYQYNGTDWEVIRKPRKVVDNTLFNDIITYDLNDAVIDYVRPYDPLLGNIPGSLIHVIDVISDVDPITYNDNEYAHSKYSQMEGLLWLDTKNHVYIDYHQGDVDYRATHWGSLFPGSDVAIYEWTKSSVVPEEYDGVVLSTSQYITQNVYEENLGIYKTYYYFWVKNPTSVPKLHSRNISANEISQSIKFPYNNGIPLLQVLDNYNLSILDSSRRLIMNDITLRINYQYQHTTVPTHTQWALIEESSEQDEVPKFIFQKMIDSILGYDEGMNLIPDPYLPLTSRYGVNRGQTWFVDIDAARKIFFDKLNDFIGELNIWDIELFWERLYGGIDSDTSLINFVDWYDEDFDPNTVITNLVNSRIEITLIPMDNNEYVKVIEPPANKPSMRDGGWTIYQYIETDDTFKKMGQSNGTIQFNIERILNEGIAEEEIENMRHIINVMFETFAVRPYHEVINDLLFSMVRLVMAEQPNNNWLFPSTYISIRQELLNLVPSLMYRTDKEQQIRDYIREAKPYHTKLREFNKINKPNDEYVPMKVTDFDKPPHVDQDKNFFILQERFIDTIKPDPDNDQVEFELEFGHMDNIRVTFGEQFVPVDQYRIRGRFIEFVTPPGKDKNYVGSIIIESDNTIHRDIIHEWNPTYGYRILDNTRDMDVWGDLAINKHIQIHYDRISYNNLVDLEKIVEIHEHAFNEEDEPYAYIDALSEHDVEEDTLLRELERITIHLYIDEAKYIVDNSHIITIEGDENYFVDIDTIMEDEIIFLNDVIVNRNVYSVIHEDGKTIYRFKQELINNDHVVIRPRTEWLTLSKKIGHYAGLNVANTTPMFVPEHSNMTIVDTDSKHPMLLENDGVINVDDEVYVFEHSDDSDDVISSGTFCSEEQGYPEEFSELRIHETMMFMSLNQLPPLVKMGYNTIASKIIQPTVAYTVEEFVTDYSVDVIVPSDQVKVILKDDVLIQNVDYTVLSDRIRLLRDQPVGETLVITDLYSNFDPNYHNSVKRIKNINGGFDSFVFDYSRVTEVPVTREFIVYDKIGRVQYMKCNEENYWTTNQHPDRNSEVVPINGTLNNMRNRLFVMLGFDLDGSNEMVNVDYEIVRGSIINNQLTRMTRGLFVGENTDFSDKEHVRIYELQVEDSLEHFVIQEAIVGITGRDSYPKYGNIFK